MDIRRNYNNPAFGMQIYRNTPFFEVLKTAKQNKEIFELDETLNSLLHVNAPDMVIIHGVNEKNQIFSTFVCGQNSVRNTTYGCKTPAEASLRALLKLIDKDDPKLMQLLKSRVKRFISEEEIIKRYNEAFKNHKEGPHFFYRFGDIEQINDLINKAEERHLDKLILGKDAEEADEIKENFT